MALQLILCMETNKTAETDYVYIKDTINNYYMINNKYKLSTIYMNGKANYKSTHVSNQIKKLKKDYLIGDSKVIYFIDTDLFESDANHAREFNEISYYCRDNEYDLVWFCHDIEEVYIGKRISNQQKLSIAKDFRKKKMIQNVSERSLRSVDRRKCVSNILCILDKYLIRKSNISF